MAKYKLKTTRGGNSSCIEKYRSCAGSNLTDLHVVYTADKASSSRLSHNALLLHCAIVVTDTPKLEIPSSALRAAKERNKITCAIRYEVCQHTLQLDALIIFWHLEHNRVSTVGETTQRSRGKCFNSLKESTIKKVFCWLTRH